MNRCPACDATPVSQVCAQCGYQPALRDGFAVHAPELADADSGYDVAHFARLAPLEAGNFWFRARNRLLLHLLARHAPDRAIDYLEIGCGTGYVLEAVAARFPGWRLQASDVLVAGLAHAAHRVPAATLMQMDARRMPFTDAFDVIGAFDVIEHIEDDVRVLGELHRSLRSDGLAVIAVPQHPWLWSAQDVAAHHARRYRRGELDRKLREAGFGIVWSGSYLALLLPLLTLSRLKPKSNAAHDPYAELRLPRWQDALLDAVMRVEGALIGVGVRFPAGGSRVVVARKLDAT